MGEPHEVTEEFIKHESTTEMDAIHPRFMEPQKPEVVRDCEIRNYYYCRECNLFFAPTVAGLKNHFSGRMVNHKPYASCFYCRGKVFEYSLNNERKLHHCCRDYKDSGQGNS